MSEAREKNQLSAQSYPWLVMRRANDGQRITFFSISKNRYYTEVIPSIQNKEICTCSHGWFVLIDLTSKACHLLNSISMDEIQLPRLEFNYECCVLSSSPSDSNCYILFNIAPQKKIILFYQPDGDYKFIEKEIDVGFKFSTTAMIEGKLYGLGPKDALVSITFKGVEIESTRVLIDEFAWPSYRNIYRAQNYLVEACGELLLVHKMYFGLDLAEVRGFLVFRFDVSENKWVKTDNLKRCTIFLSMGRSMACSAAESGVKPNSIYFTQPSDTCLRVFDLEDHTFSVTLPCPTISRDAEFDWIMMLQGARA